MINFLKYKWLYVLISSIVIGIGLFSIIKWGYSYSIDFVGGTNLQYLLNKDIKLNKVKDIFSQESIEIIDLSKKGKVVSIRTKAISDKKEQVIKKSLEKNLSVKINVLRSETVGPTLGKETVKKTIIASFLAVIGILIYMSFAFKNLNFAIAAIIAMFHDFLVVIGVYCLISHFFHAQVDIMFITALLTTMSFSIHDTIVIFDKIREYKKYEGKNDAEYYANKALTETMVRSINNSMTIVFMLLSLILLGGSTIRFFIIALLIGTLTGTYSSPFVATPILVWLEKRKKK